MDLLEQHFKKIFNEEEMLLNKFQLKIKEEINNYENSMNLLNEIDIEFNDVDITILSH
jgi:hypothetical protein